MEGFTGNRVFLSAPMSDEQDKRAVVAAMNSGWIAPAGPALQDFEEEVAAHSGRRHAVALSSGTAALHLGLKYLGVQPGDFVLVPDVTFAATAFAVSYLNATPYFVDVDDSFGNLDPKLLYRSIDDIRSNGGRVAAAIPVDLYGTPVDYSAVVGQLQELDVPILEDAAESLGSRVGSATTGSFGEASIFSFNGNKILTTSGGGMLLTDDEVFAKKVRNWATQSREEVVWYEHEEIGYNYRMSNLLAALGASQMKRLDDIVEHRRSIREWYGSGLSGLPGVSVLQDPPWGQSNAWLTVARFDAETHPGAPERVRLVLEESNIESRPVWKPMHQQPVYADAPRLLTGASSRWFTEGLCLPSGPSMTQDLVDRICSTIAKELGHK